jgi:large subunit ribosomal protein L23
MSKVNLYNVLQAPRVTEKTARVGEQGNQYVFQVAREATKADIRRAVEHLFDVNVESVRVVNMKGKSKSFKLQAGKRNDWKKAYVRVQQGQVIDLLGSESA